MTSQSTNIDAFSEKLKIEEEKDEIARDNLKAAMKARGYTSKSLAEKLDISETTIEKYRSGDRPLRRANAIIVYNMSKILKIEISYLLGEEKTDDLVNVLRNRLTNEEALRLFLGNTVEK